MEGWEAQGKYYPWARVHSTDLYTWKSHHPRCLSLWLPSLEGVETAMGTAKHLVEQVVMDDLEEPE